MAFADEMSNCWFQLSEANFQNDGPVPADDEDRISSAKRKMLGNIKVHIPHYFADPWSNRREEDLVKIPECSLEFYVKMPVLFQTLFPVPAKMH